MTATPIAASTAAVGTVTDPVRPPIGYNVANDATSASANGPANSTASHDDRRSQPTSPTAIAMSMSVPPSGASRTSNDAINPSHATRAAAATDGWALRKAHAQKCR